MDENEGGLPSEASLLKFMEMEWQDHFQTRVQTWRMIEIEALLAIALVGIDWQLDSILVTSCMATLLIILAFLGGRLTIHHRNSVEVRKITHIISIEKRLGMLTPDLFGDVTPPARIEGWRDAISMRSNTSLYILRLHMIIMAFAVLYLISRLLQL
jgi:hypothetical protein